MPEFAVYCYVCRPKTWKEMARWERKNFHRDNETRVRRGLKPLPKP